MDAESFLDHFWYRNSFYEKFLVDKLKDLGVQISEWDPPIIPSDDNGTNAIHTNDSNAKTITSSSGVVTAAQSSQHHNTVAASHHTTKRQRTVISFHPSKISFPGLPSHAESIKKHSIEVVLEANATIVKIHEENSFRGIPYSDYFNVLTRWEVHSIKNPNSMALSKESEVSIFLDFQFLKYTWLQGTIESNTKAELTEVFELWYETASHYLRLLLDNSHAASHQHSNISGVHLPISQRPSASAIAVSDGVGRKKTNYRRTDRISDDISHDGEPDQITSDGEDVETKSMLEHMDSEDLDEEDHELDEDDDLLFYDCEEGGQLPVSRSRKSNRSGSCSETNSVVSLNEMLDYYYDGDQQDSPNGTHRHRILSQDRLQQYLDEHDKKKYLSSKKTSRYRQTSTHELAVQIVETIFVFVEFAFWQVRINLLHA